MTIQTEHVHALQSARAILRDVCGVADIPDAIKSRVRSTLQLLRPPHEIERAAAHSGLTWWIQLEPAGASSREVAAAAKGHRNPMVWTAILQNRTAAGRGSAEALVCFASDERSMRGAFAERFGSHGANAATVFPGFLINDVTMSVITADALRTMDELIKRREPFSLEARLDYYRR